jgi:hypothetical protein
MSNRKVAIMIANHDQLLFDRRKDPTRTRPRERAFFNGGQTPFALGTWRVA